MKVKFVVTDPGEKLVAVNHPYDTMKEMAKKLSDSQPKQPNKSVKAIYVNEKKKTVAVKLKDGTVKTAKCSPMDEFDANVGFAIAFTRAYFGSREKLESVVASKTASVIKADPVVKEKPAKRKYTRRKKSAKEGE
jgi:hypothetical protein